MITCHREDREQWAVNSGCGRVMDRAEAEAVGVIHTGGAESRCSILPTQELIDLGLACVVHPVAVLGLHVLGVKAGEPLDDSPGGCGVNVEKA